MDRQLWKYQYYGYTPKKREEKQRCSFQLNKLTRKEKLSNNFNTKE